MEFLPNSHKIFSIRLERDPQQNEAHGSLDLAARDFRLLVVVG